jgi:hypothetical protein
MTEADKLAADVEAKTAIMTSCSDAIGTLETQAGELGRIIARSTTSREDKALASIMGNADAKAAIVKARAEQALAQEELADIVRYALPAAKAAFAEAEAAVKSAHNALSQYHAGLLKRRRIVVTKDIDHVLRAMLLPLIEELDDLGQGIANATPQAPSMFGTSNIGQLAEIVGDRRLRAAIAFAMGPRIERIYRTGYDEMKAEPLASSEARVWSLPPEHPESKAA